MRGRDVFGRQAQIILEPTDKPGWFWNIDGKDIAITVDLLRYGHHHLFLKSGIHEMHVVEHLFPLRFIGLDSVRIYSNTHWLPYDGCTKMFWEAIADQLIPDGYLSPASQRWKGAVQSFTQYGDFSPDPTKKRIVSICTQPGDICGFTIELEYSQWGTHVWSDVLSQRILIDIMRSRPLGQPNWLRPILRGLHWPHYNGVLWAQSEKNPGKVLEELARHRLLDFLGGIGIWLLPGTFLDGSISSIRGNHKTDVELLQQIM
ncbi:MAG: hypothetical protein JWO50_420 [Candidatus Kaiserbacteria bacterium]|nr:hypothetical protein [Candidatus Kaiserbacteria bacterium]